MFLEFGVEMRQKELGEPEKSYVSSHQRKLDIGILLCILLLSRAKVQTLDEFAGIEDTLRAFLQCGEGYL